MSASLEALQDDSGTASIDSASLDSAGAIDGGPEVDDLISKAAVAVDGHAAAAQASRLRMSRLSADAAASLRSAIAGECPTAPGQPSRGTTSGTRLDVQR